MKYLKKAAERKEYASDGIYEDVASIIREIRQNGDEAILSYNLKFDNCNRRNLMVTKDEINEAYKEVEAQVIEDIKSAINLRLFFQVFLSWDC